jgi:hypothetical protein
MTVLGAVALAYIAIVTAIGYHAWWPVLVAAALVVGPWLIGTIASRRETRQ